MGKRLVIMAGLAAMLAAFVAWWRGHQRFGADTVNRVVNPWLVEHGVAASSRGEIGLLEHTGRKSGTVRLTPIHPVRTAEGFRIVVPLGSESQWTRNVLAAGHCRVQVGDTVYELDEPRLVEPSEVDGLPAAAARAMGWLGFRYLCLRLFAEHPGALAGPVPGPEPVEVPPSEPPTGEPEAAPVG
jgi:deazaflavin-dependent oxidoreductase (nitroreductase family)